VNHRQTFSRVYEAPVSEVFAALGRTLAFRRWAGESRLPIDALPEPGTRYRFQNESVHREGRVVDVIRPVGLTLTETLHDAPCRVSLTLRWRIEPVSDGSLARLQVGYSLNYAASLQGSHWDRRLRQHFARQFPLIATHLQCLQQTA
jgi:uncharacterized protein YndB with AHSA1/START domain